MKANILFVVATLLVGCAQNNQNQTEPTSNAVDVQQVTEPQSEFAKPTAQGEKLVRNFEELDAIEKSFGDNLQSATGSLEIVNVSNEKVEVEFSELQRNPDDESECITLDPVKMTIEIDKTRFFLCDEYSFGNVEVVFDDAKKSFGQVIIKFNAETKCIMMVQESTAG